MIRGIGIEGVASEMGALSRQKPFIVERERLLSAICHRFGAERWEADASISKALRHGVITEETDESGATVYRLVGS